MVYFKVSKKKTIRLNKISVEEFVKKGFGKKAEYYKLLGKKEPVKKEVFKKEDKEVKKGAGS